MSWYKEDGGVVAKAIREIEIMCLAGNIPESIDIDIEKLHLGESIRLTEISLPEGSEIPGLTEETDQMVVSVNEPRLLKRIQLKKKLSLKREKLLKVMLLQKKPARMILHPLMNQAKKTALKRVKSAQVMYCRSR